MDKPSLKNVLSIILLLAASTSAFGNDGTKVLENWQVGSSNNYINQITANALISPPITEDADGLLSTPDWVRFEADFGHAVAVYGDIRIITNNGAAYIYEKRGSTWDFIQKINFDATPSRISITDTVAAFGFPTLDSVIIYQRIGSLWVQQQVVRAADYRVGDDFGSHVSLSGNLLAVSAQNAMVEDTTTLGRYTNAGAVYIFSLDGSTWIQQAKITRPTKIASSHFGQGLSLRGKYLAVSEYLEGSDLYLYRFSYPSWLFMSRFNRNSYSTWDDRSIGFIDDTLLAFGDGYLRQVEVYNISNIQLPILANLLKPSDSENSFRFGSDLSASTKMVLVGDSYASLRGYTTPPGAAYVFYKSNSGWLELFKLLASDRQGTTNTEGFGYSVSLFKNKALVGAPYYNQYDNGDGNAYYFTMPAPLEVVKSGSGSGLITSEPKGRLNGINCGVTCFDVFQPESVITLSAAPELGSSFIGWGGDCSGSEPTCMVYMDSEKSITANFSTSTPYTLSVSNNGSGFVSSNPVGINCGSDCAESYPNGTSVTLTATASTGWQFSGWSGSCSGTGSCIVNMNSNKNVGATFTQISPTTYTLTTSISGNGLISSSPVGINCGSDCAESYPNGTSVTLTATASTGWQFSGWSGSCSGAGSCIVNMNSNKNVGATFTEISPTTYNLNDYTALSEFVNGGSTTIQFNPGGINCGANCTKYTYGTLVSLTASSSFGYNFTGWSGDCWGANPCVLSMTTNKSVTANFNAATTKRLSVSKTGSGSIISNPNGIDCGTTCSYDFTNNLTVSLIPVAEKGFTFVGWGGACSGRGSCSVYMGSDQSVTAKFVNTFVLIQPAIQLLLE
jgi:hypothetical protein